MKSFQTRVESFVALEEACWSGIPMPQGKQAEQLYVRCTNLVSLSMRIECLQMMAIMPDFI